MRPPTIASTVTVLLLTPSGHFTAAMPADLAIPITPSGPKGCDIHAGDPMWPQTPMSVRCAFFRTLDSSNNVVARKYNIELRGSPQEHVEWCNDIARRVTDSCSIDASALSPGACVNRVPSKHLVDGHDLVFQFQIEGDLRDVTCVRDAVIKSTCPAPEPVWFSGGCVDLTNARDSDPLGLEQRDVQPPFPIGPGPELPGPSPDFGNSSPDPILPSDVPIRPSPIKPTQIPNPWDLAGNYNPDSRYGAEGASEEASQDSSDEHSSNVSGDMAPSDSADTSADQSSAVSSESSDATDDPFEAPSHSTDDDAAKTAHSETSGDASGDYISDASNDTMSDVSTDTTAVSTTSEGDDLIDMGPKSAADDDCFTVHLMDSKAPTSCVYAWVNDHGQNYLDYWIQVGPTGMNNGDNGWCKGIYDNILGTCGHRRSSIKMILCDNNFSDDSEGVYHGMRMNIHMKKWKPGKDNMACVTEAIIKGTCNYRKLNFHGGYCHERVRAGPPWWKWPSHGLEA